ncbi:Gfo/Idh/MocA family protein [Cohnella zeiphila]|uniref:Gfo/Idh/MocA family oxidoreductase n=1 Tax=Cohnella zeiphila TaxID=2761120 RepID=A0A7X0SR28_9BACL|nr:Gfo/Idh/MocA family oxidoreductase [Cohnella zeiphila]MBB6733544.1 Gfo/Idh/MocA family oxidoreductase [Cohnella zeiphila]
MREGRFAAAVVGCRMGRNHALTLASLPDFTLAGVCDLNAETAREVAERTGGPAVYADFDRMLKELNPDVVVIATPTDSHSRLTIRAAEAGVRGIYCEKPMAVHMGDARLMAKACAASGARLVVGHQRRMSAPYKTMRRLLRSGAIGAPYLLRASCAGDFLSDGTHSVDSLLYLAGDEKVRWVLAAMFRRPNALVPAARRYGHAVESGMMATIEFESGLRAELLTGEVRMPGRGYQDIEVFGEKGRLWRAGDAAQSAVLVQNEEAGGLRVPELDPPDGSNDGLPGVFRSFAHSLRTGEPHPLDASVAMRTMEVVMAAYESARLGERIELPLRQDRFPLDLMPSVKEAEE